LSYSPTLRILSHNIVYLLSFIRDRDFGSELILDKLVEHLVIFFYLELIPFTLENRKYEVESNLSKIFKEQDILFSIVVQLSIANEVKNTNQGDFDVVDINLLRYCLTKHGDQVSVAIL